MNKDRAPKYHELMNSLLQALHELGGSGSIEEINEAAIESLDLQEEILEIPNNPEKSNQTEIEYRLAWARTYLKKYSILDNSSRGVWIIVPEKRDVQRVNPSHVVKVVRELTRKEHELRENEAVEDDEPSDLPEEARSWHEKLHHVLIITSNLYRIGSLLNGHRAAKS